MLNRFFCFRWAPISLARSILVVSTLLMLQSCTLSLNVTDLNDNNSSASQTPSEIPGSPGGNGGGETPSVPLNPALAITSYGNYITISNQSNYAVSGTCSDVTSIDIKLNNSIISSVSCNAGTWSANLNATSIAEGAVTLSVSVAGGATDLDSKSINKDATAPSAPASIEDGDQLVSTSYSSWIVWSGASDSGSGLAKYLLRIVDNSNAEIVSWTDVGLLLSHGFTGLSLSEGQTYKAEVKAVDVAGNESSVTQGNGWYVVPLGWKLQSYLKAPNAESGDYFGYSVAISGDTIVVGAVYEDSNQTTITSGTSASANNAAADSGAVYVFKRVGTSWAQEAYIKAPNAESSDFFGSAVAISGDTIIVGSYGESSNQTTITNGTTASSDNTSPSSGAAYIFKRSGTTWIQEAYIKASNANFQDYFATAVDISGDTAIVGTWQEDSNQTTITNGTTASTNNTATDAGAVYVYKRTGVNWAQEAYIKPSNMGATDSFGYSVAIDGDTIAVGAITEDSNQSTITNGPTASADNLASNSGAVYIFKRSGSTWAQEAYIKAPNVGNADWFGYSIDISMDTVVVGTINEGSNQTTITNGTTANADNSATYSGAAYVFKRTGSTWAQEAFIKASNANASDFFGFSVSISADTIAVGASKESSNQTTITNGATASSNNAMTEAGAVYIFKRTGSTWAQDAYLKTPNIDEYDLLGQSVAIDGNTVVAGSKYDDSNQTTVTNGSSIVNDYSATNSGAAYVFVVDSPTNWQQQAYVKAPNAETGDYFGTSVAVSGDTLVVGTYSEDSNQTTITNGTTASSDNSALGSGAAYVFKRTGTTWAQEAYLKAPNAEASDRFGNSVAIFGDTIVVGAYWESSSQTTITNGPTAGANGAAYAGAAYVFKRTGSTWIQEAYLKAPNAESSDAFGSGVAISGDTIAVGAFGEDSIQMTITNGATASSDNSAADAGAVYVFKRTGSTWASEAYLKAPNAQTNDNFGVNIAIHGDTIIASASEDSNQTTITNGITASNDNSAVNSGAVYVFKRTGTTWAQEAYLKAPNANAGDFFGGSVSIFGDTIVVGAKYEDSNQTTITNGITASSDNSAPSSGAAYVFKRTGTTWSQEAYLKASNVETNDYFGNSVSIYGDTIVVGAPQEDSNQITITNGTTASSNNSAFNAGAAYVFKRTGTTWSQEAYLKAPNADDDDGFGQSISIFENTAVVGADKEDSNQTTITNGTTASSDNSAGNAGAVYIFKR